MKTKQQRTRTESGSALLAVLLIMVSMAGVSVALISTSLYRQSSLRGLYERERAANASLTGMDLALFELEEEMDFGGDGIGNVSGRLSDCDFDVAVTPVFTGPGEYTLRASGRYGPIRQSVEFVVAAESGLPFGIFGRQQIQFSGSAGADSYDSSRGSYLSQMTTDHADEDSAIGSNGDITAGGGMVWGDAMPGPTGQVLSPENVTGSTAPAAADYVPEPYVYAPPIPSAGSLSGSTSLGSGTYRYDTLSVSGGGTLTLSGDVVLYVDGEFTLSGGSTLLLTAGSSCVIHHGSGKFTVSGGGLVNQTELPKKMAVFSSSTEKFTLSGGSDCHGLIYAPRMEFVFSGGSAMFGAIVTDSVTISSSGMMHLDKALIGGGVGGGFVIKAARKIASLGP